MGRADTMDRGRLASCAGGAYPDRPASGTLGRLEAIFAWTGGDRPLQLFTNTQWARRLRLRGRSNGLARQLSVELEPCQSAVGTCGRARLFSRGSVDGRYSQAHKKKKRDDSESKLDLAELDRRWLDFRDAYGALWALRILARINQTAEVQGWPMRLVWSGFTLLQAKESSHPSEEQLEELRTTLSTLLRRFV